MTALRASEKYQCLSSFPNCNRLGCSIGIFKKLLILRAGYTSLVGGSGCPGGYKRAIGPPGSTRFPCLNAGSTELPWELSPSAPAATQGWMEKEALVKNVGIITGLLGC